MAEEDTGAAPPSDAATVPPPPTATGSEAQPRKRVRLNPEATEVAAAAPTAEAADAASAAAAVAEPEADDKTLAQLPVILSKVTSILVASATALAANKEGAPLARTADASAAKMRQREQAAVAAENDRRKFSKAVALLSKTLGPLLGDDPRAARLLPLQLPAAAGGTADAADAAAEPNTAAAAFLPPLRALCLAPCATEPWARKLMGPVAELAAARLGALPPGVLSTSQAYQLRTLLLAGCHHPKLFLDDAFAFAAAAGEVERGLADLRKHRPVPESFYVLNPDAERDTTPKALVSERIGVLMAALATLRSRFVHPWAKPRVKVALQRATEAAALLPEAEAERVYAWNSEVKKITLGGR